MKVAVITGSRADYGLLQWVIEGAQREFDTRLLVTGPHIPDKTYSEIRFPHTFASGGDGVANRLHEFEPDIVLILGDRKEIFLAAQEAFFLGIPIAHLSGGEVTEGSMDDTMRHCITKMATYHFVSAEPYRQRVIQLGEDPARVWTVGSTSLDSVRRLEFLSRAELCNLLGGLDMDRNILLATWHPCKEPVEPFLDALANFQECSIILTGANADEGGEALNRLYRAWTYSRQNARFVLSLGQLRYLSTMNFCSVVIGNSSSGIIEAPMLGKPTVNIGTRQDGRLRASSICDVEANRHAIRLGIALSLKFDEKVVSPYGNGHASERIIEILQTLKPERGALKKFHDLPCQP